MKSIRPEDTYIKEMFNRMKLQHIREFMMYGTGDSDISYEAYDKRLKEGSNPIFKRIDSLYANDNSERERIASDISHALAVHEEVYMEIGMKAGARLIYQLLLSDSPIPLNFHESDHGSDGTP